MRRRRKFRSLDTARTGVSIERLESRELLVSNLALFQPTFVDSTFETMDPSETTVASEATDGIVSNDSRWASQNNANAHWVEVQLSTPYPVGSAHVYLGLDDTNNVSAFDLQYHNGSSWQTITSVVGDHSTDHNLVFSTTIDTATRFRIHASGSQLQVKEFVLLPPNGPAGYPLGTAVDLNLATVLPPGPTSVEGTNYAINATDGYVSNDSSWIPESSSGTHRLALRLQNSHEVGSVHLYSGEAGSGGTTINPLSDFTIQYSNNFGSSYTNIPGGTVSSGTMTGGSITGNSSSELVINFSTPVLANRIRISFTQAGGAVREMVALPANTSASGSGYEIGTSVKFESPPAIQYDDYGDSWYRIVSRQNNRALIADESGATQTVTATPQVSRQYQLLSSYALDAYRIRAEDSGLALQVKDASLDEGAAIVEGDYSAAPHQLWRLEPTDGGYFQIVNVWSGLVLQTGGSYPNVVTQKAFDSAADPANRVEWKLTFIDDYFKKGTASATVGSFGSSWSYNWGRGDFDDLSYDQFYVPMQFREGWPNFTTLHQNYDDWNDELKPSYLLGFNEPDREDQADMTVAAAVGLWAQLQAIDVPLVSPGNAHGATGLDWLEDFSDQTDALGYRTDYAATHWYSSPSINNILNYVDSTQTKSNGRDVWLTEFAVIDWSNGSGDWSEETNYNFILEFLYRAESKANLDKYALFLWTGAEPATPWEKSNPRSDFFISNSNKALTPFGKAYAGWDGETEVKNETLYIVHNRAAAHRLQNDGGSDVEKASIRVEDDSAQWIIQDAGNDEVYITSAVDGRRAKLDGGNIVMSEPGATGWGVRWKIQQDIYGWQNIVHSGSGNYLRLNRVNDADGAPTSQTLDVVTASAAASLNSTDWWFVKPYEPAVHSDYGDAPDSYPVTLADDGARHTVAGPMLGLLAEAETDGANSADSLFDDISDLDDEDGITFVSPVFASSAVAGTASVDVQLSNADAASNRLDAWVDFNGDGDWLDPGEQIFTNFNLGTTDGIQTLSFAVPTDTGTNIQSGETHARFRLSTAGNLSVTGATFDGEVEDYAVTIVDAEPDLVATAFNAVPDHALYGQTDVIFTVANIGAAAAGAFQTHVVWSANNVPGDGDDVLVAGTAVLFTGLAAGISESKTVSLQLDQATLYANAMAADVGGLPVGTVSADSSRLFLVVDINNDVSESDETNNSGQGYLTDNDNITYFPWDKNSNGVVEPLEAITSIQAIGSSDSATDFDGNGIVSPLEALSAVQRIGYVRGDVASKAAVTAAVQAADKTSQLQVASVSVVEALPVLAARSTSDAVREASDVEGSASDLKVAFARVLEDEEKGIFGSAVGAEQARQIRPASLSELMALDAEFEDDVDWLSVL